MVDRERTEEILKEVLERVEREERATSKPLTEEETRAQGESLEERYQLLEIVWTTWTIKHLVGGMSPWLWARSYPALSCCSEQPGLWFR